MNCPNCDQTFVLRYDYARHLRSCRPLDASGDDAEAPPVRRPPVADVLFDEIDLDAPSPSDERASATALAGDRG